MRPLKEFYSKNSYNHRLVWRDEDYAITELSDQDTNKVYGYEAFEIIKHEARETKVMKTEAFESCPSNEQWGQKGYTAISIGDAHNKIKRLKSKKDGRETKTTRNHQTITA